MQLFLARKEYYVSWFCYCKLWKLRVVTTYIEKLGLESNFHDNSILGFELLFEMK